MTPLVAPWTDEQVEALNRYQQEGWMHPFTCGYCRDNDERWPSPDEHILEATKDGWTCPTCDYTQNWAHEFMTQEPPESWMEIVKKREADGSGTRA